MDNNNVMISVIIPVYNAEKYLKQAIESILDQNYTSWELLLIDDGSTDQSPQIEAKYASEYDNIMMIKNQSNGAGFARNTGLSHAHGEYILFVDADDHLPEQTVFDHFLSIAAKTKADIVVSNYARLWNGNLLPATDHDQISAYPAQSQEFRFRGFFSVGTLSYVWGKLYRRSFLEVHKIRFTDHTYAEDKLFNMKCYVCDAKYAFLSDRAYIYRKNDDSISFQYHADSVHCWLGIGKDLRKWILKQHKSLNDYHDLIEYTLFFASFFDGKMEYIEHDGSIHSVQNVLKQYNEDPLGKRCFQRLCKGKQVSSLKDTMWKIMIRGFSFGMKWHWYFLLSVGIKLLIDLRIDERLSDTGLRTSQQMKNGDITMNKEFPLISVIIPVYNIETYLSECIDSVLAQTYPNLEIILVDDGTPDHSGEICDTYQKNHDNIFVIHKTNGGLSSARNAGLSYAHGEYIYFLDGDDLIHPDTIKRLYSSLSATQSDIAICGIQYVDASGTFILDQDSCREYSAPDGIWSQNDFWNSYQRYGKIYCVVAWNKLYKKEIFKTLRFPEGKIREDEFMIHHIISKCHKISCIHDKLCYYRQQDDSIMSDPYSVKQLDAADAYMDRIQFYQKRHESKRVDAALLDLIAFLEWFAYGMDPKDPSVLHRYQCQKRKICCWIHKYNQQIKSPVSRIVASLYVHGLFPYKFLKDLWWKIDRIKRKILK